jgi:hypothetical protein
VVQNVVQAKDSISAQQKGRDSMQLEIEPVITVALFSDIRQGVVVQLMDGTRAITAVVMARQPPDKLLITYDAGESKFQYNVLDGNPSMIAFEGQLILKPDVASAFEGRPNASARNEVYFEGTSPLVAVHIRGAAPGVRLLNLASGIIEASHEGQMIAFRKWSICVREGGVLHKLMEFKPSMGTVTHTIGR